jgi:hypothetical protein
LADWEIEAESVTAADWAIEEESVTVADWAIEEESVTVADWAIETDWVIGGESATAATAADSAIETDWLIEENLVREPRTEGNVFNRRPMIVGNRGTIGLAKIRTG